MAGAILPGTVLGRPGSGRGHQSIQELANGDVHTAPLAVTSDPPINGPDGLCIAFDEPRAQMVAISTQTGTWRSGGATHPAHIFAIGLEGVVAPSDVNISAVDVDWSTTATSKLSGAASTGLTFAVWSVDHWRQTLSGAPVDAAHWTLHVDSTSVGGKRTLDSIVVGSSAQIFVAAMPDGLNADLASYASITTDFVRGRVTYRHK